MPNQNPNTRSGQIFGKLGICFEASTVSNLATTNLGHMATGSGARRLLAYRRLLEVEVTSLVFIGDLSVGIFVAALSSRVEVVAIGRF